MQFMALHPAPALTSPFPALMTSFPVNIFLNFEAPKVSDIMTRNPHSSCFILCLTASQTPSINTPELIHPYIHLEWLNFSVSCSYDSLPLHFSFNSTINCRSQSYQISSMDKLIYVTKLQEIVLIELFSCFTKFYICQHIFSRCISYFTFLSCCE